MKKWMLAAGAMLAAGGLGLYCRNFRVPLKEYTACALYMAVMDDEITRRELEGIELEGGTVELPPRQESLRYRYHLFLELNKGKTGRELREEILALEQRLEEPKV